MPKVSVVCTVAAHDAHPMVPFQKMGLYTTVDIPHCTMRPQLIDLAMRELIDRLGDRLDLGSPIEIHEPIYIDPNSDSKSPTRETSAPASSQNNLPPKDFPMPAQECSEMNSDHCARASAPAGVNQSFSYSEYDLSLQPKNFESTSSTTSGLKSSLIVGGVSFPDATPKRQSRYLSILAKCVGPIADSFLVHWPYFLFGILLGFTPKALEWLGRAPA